MLSNSIHHLDWVRSVLEHMMGPRIRHPHHGLSLQSNQDMIPLEYKFLANAAMHSQFQHLQFRLLDIVAEW